jgi:putative transposase
MNKNKLISWKHNSCLLINRRWGYQIKNNVMNIQPLMEGQYFHIYNRGINGEDIFKEQRNYYYFLHQYMAYCSEVMETLAYALLKNHFHLLVYIKENVQVPRHKGHGMIQLNASKQLSHFFNSYVQSINKAGKRTGSLFESPFERKLIDDDSYLTAMVYYCHYNAQLHDFVYDFKEWEFSSYHTIFKNDNSFLASQKVLDWFGGVTPFKKAHENRHYKDDIGKFIIE